MKKSSRVNKGQVAMEYLVTYGWAILLLVIVAGILFSSFSPTFLVSEHCSIDENNLPCYVQAYNQGQDLIVLLNISNGFGYPIKLEQNGIKVVSSKGDNANIFLKTNRKIIPPGSSFVLTIVFPNKKQSPNSIIDATVLFPYQSCAQEINQNCVDNSIGKHTKSGKIVARVVQ